MKQQRHHIPIGFAVLALLAALAPAVARADVKAEGRTVTTSRQVIEIAESGLPSQVFITPQTEDLPLALRNRPKLNDADLLAVGRGPVLREPISVLVDGKAVEMKVDTAAAIDEGNTEGDTQKFKAAASFGVVSTPIETAVADGGMVISLRPKSSGKIGRLSLALPLAGQVDTLVWYGNLGKLTVVPLDGAAGPGTIWQGGDESVKRKAIDSFYVGNGDRGVTVFLRGFDTLDASQWNVRVERSEAGDTTCIFDLANNGAQLTGKPMQVSLIVHPTKLKPADARAKQWLEPTQAEARIPDNQPVEALRADMAAAFEGGTDWAVLAGEFGGDLPDAQSTHADTYPIEQFRYLASTHTGLMAVVRSNVGKLVSPGAHRSADRMLLGRALLHDIGVTAGSVAHTADYAAVLRILSEHGLLEADGKTEFIPYWRTPSVVRYGEDRVSEGAFALDPDAAATKVEVSVYRRPSPASDGKPAGIDVIFVVVNETDHDVRERLHVLNSNAVFGKQGNTYQARDSRGSFVIPESRVAQEFRGVINGAGICLGDLETRGVIARAESRGRRNKDEIYGPVHVPAKSYRILIGRGQ